MTMNFAPLIPPPNMAVSKPIKITPKGNLYKVAINHLADDGKTVNKYEVWTTKEAVQQHFQNIGTEEPKKYELKKFAKQMYEKQLRSTSGNLQHKGIFVTTDSISHGDPRLWPSTLSHPEVKM